MDTSLSDDVIVAESSSRGRRVLSFLLWSALTIGLLLFFTILKLPQQKIHAYVTGFIGSQLAPAGIRFTAESGSIGAGFGIYYKMENVTLTKVATNKTMKLSSVQASPAFLALLQGKIGAHVRVESGTGYLAATVLTRGEDTEVSFNASELNLGFMGALPFLADIQGTALVEGDGEIIGNFLTPSTLSGNVKVGLSRIVLDQQSVMGILPIPKASISDGVIDITLGSGKALLNQFRIGKPGGSDDLHLNLTGDVRLGRSIDASEANLRGKATLPESLKKDLSFIIQRFATPNGGLAFRLNGPLSGMMPSPDPS